MGGDGDEVAGALGRGFQELFVAGGEGVDLGGEGGIDHGDFHRDESETLAGGDALGAVPLLGFVEIEERVDGELEGGQAGAGRVGFLDAAAGGDDGGENVAVLGAALEPITGCLEFAIGGLEVPEKFPTLNQRREGKPALKRPKPIRLEIEISRHWPAPSQC